MEEVMALSTVPLQHQFSHCLAYAYIICTSCTPSGKLLRWMTATFWSFYQKNMMLVPALVRIMASLHFVPRSLFFCSTQKLTATSAGPMCW
ncbi:hypothetical protein B0T17DRAFT_521093 [Bombardia bombarda]|uniref:Uncharacterized protein n=1 Tax=Bombardia bombarda TaxID=252184 RepID=A0AA39XND7_9PEZI|nr:hypothetical protein B0T17DRAFT_521093 [Bombardia bombarda]